MRKSTILGALVALAVFAGAAHADVITDNASLASPGGGAPGVFFGSGNANVGFTVNQTTAGPELGLSAVTRFEGAITPVGNVYNAPAGATTDPGHTGAAWGFDFSVDLNPGGHSTTLILADVTAQLFLVDVGNGRTGSVTPLVIPDNAEFGSGGVVNYPNESPTNWAAQNSEALSFSSVATALGDPNYDVNASDTYNFTLNLYCADNACGGANTLLGSDAISVVVGAGATVPEPASLSLLVVGLLGLCAFHRRGQDGHSGHAMAA